MVGRRDRVESVRAIQTAQTCQQEETSMKTPSLVLAAVLICAASLPPASAGPLAVGSGDTIASLLSAQKGTRVTLRLRSGQDRSGVVRSVGSNLAHIGELSGKEFYDAAVNLSDIEAVIVRVKDR